MVSEADGLIDASDTPVRRWLSDLPEAEKTALIELSRTGQLTELLEQAGHRLAAARQMYAACLEVMLDHRLSTPTEGPR